MRILRVCFAASLSLLLSISVLAQNSTTKSSPHALALLQQSLAALTGGKPITDITLSGTARRIAGSSDESGTVTYQAISGAHRLDLTLSGGPRSEVANSTGASPGGSWAGPDGISHPMAVHNLTNQATISPAFTLLGLSSDHNLVVTLLGEESKGGHPVYHLSGSQQFPRMSGKAAALEQHLTQIDIFLDSSTLLPVAFGLSAHPDRDAGLDIPVEILFSDYRAVNGAQIPFHVQKLFNGSLLLDLQFTSAQLNSGLSATNFAVEAGL